MGYWNFMKTHETSRAIYEQIVDIIEKNGLRVSQITVDGIPFFS